VTDRLIGACRRCFDHNLGLRAGERVAVVTDALLCRIGNAFETAARESDCRVALLEIPVARRNGEEPPAEAALMMAEADVAVLPLARSISWTRARVRATEAGTRLASMPGVTAEILLRNVNADYDAIRKRVNGMADLLDSGCEVRVSAEAGTDLVLRIDRRRAHGRKGGLYREAGHWGNLPCGEAFIAPLEGSAEGVYVVDGSQAGVGELKMPIRIEVRDGRAVAIRGADEADRLRAALEAADDPLAFNLAELGIGCNDAARGTGVTLEDEKALGTCHLALGSNAFFGGTVEVGLHLDGVIRDPSLWIDGAPLLERGRLTPDVRQR